MKRRAFLSTLVATGLMPTSLVSVANPGQDLRFLSVRGDRQRRYFVSSIDVSGRVCFDLPLPQRAHGIAVHPSGDEAMVIARRPGSFLQRIDLRQGRLLEQLTCDPQRHLYGHAVYATDGSRLYTTENDFEAGRGVIAVRDVNDGYRQVDEFESGGLGPHELRLLSDGRTLVVANGGIRTHPDFDRTPLNLGQMQPSLAYIARRDGRLLESRQLPASLHQNSIRHLAVGSGDRVCLAMQFQGARDQRPPLIALHRRGLAIQLLKPPSQVLADMQNYCGSVCVDASGDCFAVSSPRGDLITFWSAVEGHYLGHTSVADGCGIAAGQAAGEFLLSSGTGGLFLYRVSQGVAIPLENSADRLWDNHMAALG
jgi:hypothetical protein